MPRQKVKIDIAKVEELAGKGMSLDQISTILGIGTRTFFRHRQDGAEMADLADAIKRGRAKRIEEVVNKLQDHINDGNLTAIIFFLKTQAGWKETTRQELSGIDGAPLAVAPPYDMSKFTPEALIKMARENHASKNKN